MSTIPVRFGYARMLGLLLCATCTVACSSRAIEQKDAAVHNANRDQRLYADGTEPDQWVYKPAFGELCDPNSPLGCLDDADCRGFSVSTIGMCTKPCTDIGGPCSGGSAGTLPMCVGASYSITGEPTFLCLFLCELQTPEGDLERFPCPPQLYCKPTPEDPSVKVCFPP